MNRSDNGRGLAYALALTIGRAPNATCSGLSVGEVERGRGGVNEVR